MSDDQVGRATRPREAPAFTSDPRDEYVHRVVSWALAATGIVLMAGGFATLLIGWTAIDQSGAGTPLPMKVVYMLSGLSMIVGLGLALASTGVPTPSRTYKSQN